MKRKYITLKLSKIFSRARNIEHKAIFTLVEDIAHTALSESQHKVAFTLAETLITLVIIGVVAALTISDFVDRFTEKRTVTQLKVAYSLLWNAFTRMVDEHGTIDGYAANNISHNTERQNLIMDYISEYLNIVENCGSFRACMKCPLKHTLSDTTTCGYAGTAKGFKLSNGMTVLFHTVAQSYCVQNVAMNQKGIRESGGASLIYYGTYYHSCGTLYVDINGNHGPNTFNKDIFEFRIVKDGIVPAGSKKDGIWVERFENSCLGTGQTSLTGSKCTAWVLANENMDYLRCPEKLGWDKSKSCKN